MKRRIVVAFGVLFGVVVVWSGSAPSVDAGTTPSEPTCNGRVATNSISVAGTLNGSSGDDVLIGSSGADVIRGNGGNDTICGGDGADEISGGSGNDLIFGEGDNDELNGDAGDDIVSDNIGFNVAHGGSGVDWISVTGIANGDSGNDDFIQVYESCSGCRDGEAYGGSGNDALVRVVGGVADGNAGSDRVEGLAPGDDIRGGSGNDTVVSIDNGEGQTVNGGSGRDDCQGGDDDDYIACEKIGPRQD